MEARSVLACLDEASRELEYLGPVNFVCLAFLPLLELMEDRKNPQAEKALRKSGFADAARSAHSHPRSEKGLRPTQKFYFMLRRIVTRERVDFSDSDVSFFYGFLSNWRHNAMSHAA